MLKVKQSKRIAVQLQTGKAAHPVSFGHEFIAVEGHRRISLGTSVIIEHKFCQSAVIIRLCKVRFSLCCQIEIVDGEHIVVHRQHISAYIHNLLGINLGFHREGCRRNGYYSNQKSDFHSNGI